MTFVVTLLIMAFIGAVCYPLGKRIGQQVSPQTSKDLVQTRRWVRRTSLLGGVTVAAVIVWVIFDSGNVAILIAIMAVLTAAQVVFTWQHLR
jgi:di/tricarboxylate transporter